ncbi:TCP-1/cpn60 chaperonin family protein [Naumannella cuiyingiana]|uniref:Uncharacterized protein n=1 Tax=Naumannella cuiyingiana TaxID=1347891 RepID=A0A7Z0D898_9ACTN|nr:hypothetical protein [Naumannella cuiyingiana]NYI70650.1 hypothetical protein [Naumannella cuiyingiana]
MEPWQWGLVIVLGLGIALIAYGVLTDRIANRDLQRSLHAPPTQAVPGFRPDAVAPAYLTELEARHTPTQRAPLPDETITRLRAWMDDTAVSRCVDAGLVSADFVTEPDTGWAVALDPQVLVCATEVTDIRELLGVLEGASAAPRSLIVVAPGYADEVRVTLEVNALQGTVGLIAVRAEQRAAADICTATAAEAVPRETLQAGALRPEQLGDCRAWIADRHASWIVRRVAEPD